MITLKQAEELTKNSKIERVCMKNGKNLTPARALMAKYNRKIPYDCPITREMENVGLNGQIWTTCRLLDTYGKGYIESAEDTMREKYGISYYYAGDRYALTLCYFRGKWQACSVADIEEKYPKLFQ